MSDTSSVDFHWLDGKPSSNTHTTEFGCPWAQGSVYKSTAFALKGDSGKGIPVQSYPLAYWPDGSLKWSGHTIPPQMGLDAEKLTLSVGTPVEPENAVLVEQSNGCITISTGTFQAIINTSGSTLIKSMSIDGVSKATDGYLVMQFQDKPDLVDENQSLPTITSALGCIELAEVEMDGPVRAVVKVQGRYYPQDSSRAPWLPFTARLIVGAGGTEVRLVHYFLFDGDLNKDFIKGLGLKFHVPFGVDERLWDRPIRFASVDGGVWGESVNVLTGLRRDVTTPVSSAQFAGTPTPDTSTWPTTVTPYLDTLPTWNDYALHQLDADTFSIWKRTGSDSSWQKHAGFGQRAAGVGFVGGAKYGGIAFSERDFWEMFPRSLEVKGAGGDSAEVSIWAYSPAGEAMDLRHYTQKDAGLNLQYEDNPDPSVTSTPYGMARSYEISLIAYTSAPSRDTIGALGKVSSSPPQLFADPSFYASMNLFGGRWSTPDSDLDLELEKKQDSLLTFYVNERDQRKWWGFWNAGDVMHTYDSVRHEWRYDIGGYAWDNAELGTDLWVWFAFLRTGRADVYRMAHLMTRHITESDTYHLGTFVGLGSRHNVSHWGDGAKEARVGGSHLKRPMYYLTGGDETLGDLLRISLAADQTLVTWPPLRSIIPTHTAPTLIRIGPDWTALVGNWYTEWERTGNDYYRDRIETGMKCIGAFPNGLFQGYTAAVGFDPATGILTAEESTAPSFADTYHLTMLFGGGELLMEVVEVINVPSFDKAWIDFCWLYSGTATEKTARYGQTWNSGGFTQLYAKLLAYAGQRLNDQSLIDRAWTTFNTNKVGVWPNPVTISGSDFIRPITEIKDLATNDSASLSLTLFALLAIYPQGAPRSLKAASSSYDASRFTTLHDDASSDSASTIIGVPAYKSEQTTTSAPSGSISDLEGQAGEKKLGVWGRIKRALGF